LETQPEPSGSKFLIVENDPNDAFLIRRAINSSPYCGSSVVCRNPSEAKAYLKGAGMYRDRELFPIPDVILSDMRMGVESGLELVDWVRKQNAPLKDTPFIILTGSSTPLQFDAAQKVGADRVYSKPLRLEDLQELLNKIAAEFCGAERRLKK